MNRWRYERVISQKFLGWIRASFGVQRRGVLLVQDHERCLWAREPRDAMDGIGIHLLTNYPKCSQDINPIETVWRELRCRLNATQPAAPEGRDEFISRLRTAVAWLNRNRCEYMMHLCNCQAEWARDVLAHQGGRTKH